jgi:hypothetical protein
MRPNFELTVFIDQQQDASPRNNRRQPFSERWTLKLVIKNLGRIARAEIPIKPLTVFIGPNNSNKTWTAYALYTLACECSLRSSDEITQQFQTVEVLGPLPAQLQQNIERENERLRQSISELLRVYTPTSSEGISLSSPSPQGRRASASLEVHRAKLLEGLTEVVHFRLQRAALARTLALSEQLFRDTEVALEYPLGELQEGLFDKATFSIGRLNPLLLHIHGYRENRAPDLISLSDVSAWKTTMPEWTSILKRVAIAMFNSVIPFPAERKALASLGGLLSDTLRHAVHAAGVDLSNITSLPVVSFLSWLPLFDYLDRFNPQGMGMRSISDLLERRILKGEIRGAGEQSPSPPNYYAAGMQGPLPMHASSSLVRALAGLDLYLKHLALPGDFLVIDEPEMNAHPESQLAITELLAILVNKGLHVTMTTHSPYIVDHLNNLIEASKLPPDGQSIIEPEFKLGNREAFLSPDKVSVQFFQEDDGRVSVHDIFDQTTSVIDWSTFSRPSAYLSSLYNKILAQE